MVEERILLSLYSGLCRRPLTACNSFFLRYHTRAQTRHGSLFHSRSEMNSRRECEVDAALCTSLPSSLLAVEAVTQGGVKLDLTSCTLARDDARQRTAGRLFLENISGRATKQDLSSFPCWDIQDLGRRRQRSPALRWGCTGPAVPRT